MGPAEQPQDEVIGLPKSGLYIQNNTLCRRSPDGSVHGKHSLQEIEDAEIRTAFDPIGIVLGSTLAALALFAKYIIPYEGLGWTVGVVLLLAAVFGLGVMSRKTLLHVRSAHGEARYLLNDLQEDCEGFVLTLRSRLHPKASNGLPSGER